MVSVIFRPQVIKTLFSVHSGLKFALFSVPMDGNLARLSMGGWSLCHASLVFEVRGRVRVLGLGLALRVVVVI